MSAVIGLDHGSRRIGVAVGSEEIGQAFARPAILRRGQAKAARDFGAQLAAIGLEVVLLDERLTSWQAGMELAAEGRRPSRASGERDSAAARLILQEYLDGRAAPARPQEAR